jgi:tripartite ATP-independent transporter DctM subunit
MVVGVIFLGVASPTEAAATGAIGMFLLAAAYRRLNWEVAKKAITSTIGITGMIFLIIASARAFSQILAASGATQGMIGFVMGLPLTPLFIVIAMQVVFLFMGMFMTSATMVMIAIPIFMPIVRLLGFDTVWFAVIVLLNMEMAQTSPPFGASLFVMKGVAPPDTTMGDIYRAALPFLYLDLIAMALIIIFPQMALWLPALMR